MSIEIDDLIESLVNLINVQSRYNKEVAEYDGYSWDWAGQYIIEELNEAKENTKNVLDKYIDERVEAKIELILDKRDLNRPHD